MIGTELEVDGSSHLMIYILKLLLPLQDLGKYNAKIGRTSCDYSPSFKQRQW